MMFAYEGGWFEEGSAAPVWLILLGLLGFIASHAFGQGSVIWVFISEIFPNRVRARGQSLGSLTHWVFAFITTYAFPVLTDSSVVATLLESSSSRWSVSYSGF